MNATERPTVPRDHLVALARRGVHWPSWGRRAYPGLRPAAVLVLFGALDADPARHTSTTVPADLDVLLVGRAHDLSDHPGQVAFPGGRLEPDDAGPVDAALREAAEETGLDPSGVEVLAALGDLPVPASQHLVTPVLGWWAVPSPVRVVDVGESAAVFRAPVADLLDPANRGTVVITHDGREYRSPAFEVADHVVWGFTGLVLDHLFTELNWTEPWQTDRVLPLPGPRMDT